MKRLLASARLSLEALDASEIDELLGGASTMHGAAIGDQWPVAEPDQVAMLQFFRDRLLEKPEWVGWRFRLIIRSADRTVVGHVGFHGPPEEGCLELGYTVFPRYRRQGIASESVRALMDAAFAEHGVGRFRLSIGESNAASLDLAERLGFMRIGEQIDEVDGLELIFERTWPDTFRPR